MDDYILSIYHSHLVYYHLILHNVYSDILNVMFIILLLVKQLSNMTFLTLRKDNNNIIYLRVYLFYVLNIVHLYSCPCSSEKVFYDKFCQTRKSSSWQEIKAPYIKTNRKALNKWRQLIRSKQSLKKKLHIYKQLIFVLRRSLLVLDFYVRLQIIKSYRSRIRVSTFQSHPFITDYFLKCCPIFIRK